MYSVESAGFVCKRSEMINWMAQNMLYTQANEETLQYAQQKEADECTWTTKDKELHWNKSN